VNDRPTTFSMSSGARGHVSASSDMLCTSQG
jgi:hypothetical protein